MVFRETPAVYCQSHKQARQYTVLFSTAREPTQFVPTVRNPVSVGAANSSPLQFICLLFWAYFVQFQVVQLGSGR